MNDEFARMLTVDGRQVVFYVEADQDECTIKILFRWKYGLAEERLIFPMDEVQSLSDTQLLDKLATEVVARDAMQRVDGLTSV